MNENLQIYLVKYREKLETTYNTYFSQLDIPSNLKDSMLYSLEAGGKRLRPILMFASYEVYGKTLDKVMSSAVALEMIHTYSLIHDDLPAMDDDDYRRGKLTNHKQFNEATAILAGDALLTYSFQLISSDELLSSEEKVQLIRILSEASGPSGMVAGQILDMEAEKQAVSLNEMEEIHALKTGELIRFAIFAGAYLGGASDNQLKHLTDYAYYLGLIFQVQDDILDITGDASKIGKPVGSDELNEKSTYPKLLGLDGAIEQKNHYVDKAFNSLQLAGAEDSLLTELTKYFSERDH
ncbi:polyprenyl synthetase family protein [Oceanobacillus sp. 1P07AA]|uniref:polyprenyl synthetase family protein n=1 Tax=Oceanobacillus sp. 1P07AA TaxID=3132293 RepID=UPI0039A76DE9